MKIFIEPQFYEDIFERNSMVIETLHVPFQHKRTDRRSIFLKFHSTYISLNINH